MMSVNADGDRDGDGDGCVQVKDDLMYECVKAKFSQHDSIQRTLLKTEDALLVEHTSNGKRHASVLALPLFVPCS
jgi:hypothetical protein